MAKGEDTVLKWFVKKQLEAFGRRWNYDMGYVREIVDEAGVGAIMPLQALQKLGGLRSAVPLAAFYGASLTAAKHADCGPCLQLGVSMAEAAGLSPLIIRAILRQDLQALPAEALLGVELAQAAIHRDGSGDDAREEILRRWGRRGLVALAYGIVAAQAYPAFKYAIGHGHACVRIRVGNEHVAMKEPNFA